MKTIFDWATLAIFISIVVVFLQRSTSENYPEDRIWHYAPPAIGCALANFVGNQGVNEQNLNLQFLAGAIMLAVVGYIFHIIKPFKT